MLAGPPAARVVIRTRWPAVAAGAALAVCAVSQRRHERRSDDLRPTGRIVAVGGTNLHYRVAGRGAPTVIFEAGAGGTLDSWALVIPRIAAVTRTIAYDRAGLGFSGAAPLPDDRRPLAVARRLAQLLQTIGARPPYVLVGHSLGGLAVRSFASECPNEVAGLVLVDPSHEQMQSILSSPSLQVRLLTAAFNAGLDIANRLACLGTSRLVSRVLVPARLARQLGLDQQEVAALRARSGRIASLRAGTAERRQLAGALEQGRELRVPSRIPVTVLSGDRLDAKGRHPHLRRGINELHAELAARSAAGRHVVVADCGHLVPIEQPDAIVDEILAMVRAYRDA